MTRHEFEVFAASAARNRGSQRLSGLAGISAESGKGVKKVIVANQIAITQLERALNANKQCKIITSTAYHPHLLAVKVSAAEPKPEPKASEPKPEPDEPTS